MPSTVRGWGTTVNRPAFTLQGLHANKGDKQRQVNRQTRIAICVSNKEMVTQADLSPHVEKHCFRNGSFSLVGISIIL